MEYVLGSDFKVKREGRKEGNFWCVYKHPEDRVGVWVKQPTGYLEDLDEFEAVLKDVAAWAWNSALGTRG